MCFSAAASFATAAATVIVGFAALHRAGAWRAWPLAAMPLIFAVQQALEGTLWLSLAGTSDGLLSGRLVAAFLFFATVLWPIYAPLSVWLIEADERRRRFMLAAVALGAGVSTHMAWALLTHPTTAVLHDNHIAYHPIYTPSLALGLAYLAATGAPLALSSYRAVALLGAVVLVGSAVAFLFYWESFVSVWCFFAAAASVVILGHFERARRLRANPARA